MFRQWIEWWELGGAGRPKDGKNTKKDQTSPSQQSRPWRLFIDQFVLWKCMEYFTFQGGDPPVMFVGL